MLIQFKDRTGNWKYEMPFDVNQRDLSGQSILYLACCIGNLRFAFHFFGASGSGGYKPFASGSHGVNLLIPVPMVVNLLLLSKNVLLKETALHESLLLMPSCCNSCTKVKLNT
jgi:hypothetical protein